MANDMFAVRGVVTPRIGGTPGSAGYQWYPEKNGWMRPWDATSFIPASQKSEWDIYIPGALPPESQEVVEKMDELVGEKEATVVQPRRWWLIAVLALIGVMIVFYAGRK